MAYAMPREKSQKKLYNLCVRMQIDGGSNCNLGCAPQLWQIGEFQPEPGVIGGIADGLDYDGVVSCGAVIGEHSLTLAMLRTPNGQRNILSESVLLDEYGITCPKEPPCLRFPDGSTVPMVREDGLFFVDLALCASIRPSRVASPIANVALSPPCRECL